MRAPLHLLLEVVPAQLADHLLVPFEGEGVLLGLCVEPLDLPDLPGEGRASKLALIRRLLASRVGAACPAGSAASRALLVLRGLDFPQDDVLVLGLEDWVGSLRPLVLEHPNRKAILI